MRSATAALVTAVVVATTGPAAGNEPVADDAVSSIDTAPAADDASGVLVPRDRSDQAWLSIPRSVLFVPRAVLSVPFAVPRYSLWAYEHYHLRDRYIRWFFTDDETFGIYPTVLFETGFGVNGGLRTVYRGLVGDRGTFHARAGYGGRYDYIVSADVETGPLWGGALELGLEARLETHPGARFFGIGNGDLVGAAATIDPLVDDTAVTTRYRHDGVRVEIAARVQMPGDVVARLRAALSDRAFDDEADLRDDAATTDVYDRTRLVGYDTGLRNLSGEVQLVYDTRRTTRPYLPAPAPSTGWRVAGSAGIQRGLGDDPSKFARFGADVQRYFDLWLGDRILIVRAYAELTTGDLATTPFIDLPALGGPHLLRGYARDRFRGPYAAVTTVEYTYPIQRNATGYLFVDAGRVWRDGDSVAVGDARVGYGIGVQLHTVRSFVGRVFLASSIDGGVEINLSLNPVFGPLTSPVGP